jgi:hypothetical protein
MMEHQKWNTFMFFRQLVLLLVLVFMYLNVLAQITKVEGFVVDDLSGEPLPFTNIYFLNTTIGTVSDTLGRFSIKSRQHNDTLVFSQLGYNMLKVYVEKGKTYHLIIRLDENTRVLNEVTIKPGENPAHPIFRKIIENKFRNNPDKYAKYSCRTYTNLAVSFVNVHPETFDNRLLKQLRNVLPESPDSAALLSVPIFYSEKVNDNYIDNVDKDVVVQQVGIRQNGIGLLEDIDVKGYANAMSAEVNFYNNYVELFKKRFVSPIANSGLQFYRYYLEDSIVTDKGMEYRIRYFPKRKKDPAFTGEFTVVKDIWALSSITATLPSSANVNFLNTFTIAFDFAKVNDSVFFFKENNFSASFNYSKFKAEKNKMVMEVAKTTTYSDILLDNKAKRPATADSLKRREQKAETDSIIDYHRLLAKNQASVNTIGTLDSINNIGWVKFMNKNTEMLFTGYFNFGKFDLGPYLELIRWNNVEGLRLSFSGRTSEQLSKRFFVGGKLGYGFRDEEWKYGGSFGWKFKTDKRSVIGLEYDKDLLLLGALGRIFLIKGDGAATGEDSFIASFFKRWQNDRRSILYSFRAYIEREIHRGVTVMLAYNYLEMQQSQFVPFVHNDKGVAAIFSNSITMAWRLSWNEKVMDKYFRRYYFGTHYPIVSVVTTFGRYTVAGNSADYLKLHLLINHNFNMGATWFKYILETGAVFGKVPFPLLEQHRGNETYGYSRYRFNLLNNSTVASDRYFSVMAEYHTNGILMSRLPLIRELNIRAVFDAKYLYGYVSRRHEEVLEFPWDMRVPGDHYLELGFGFENIMKILRIEAVWRPVPVYFEGLPNFGVLVRLQFSL